MKKTFRIFLFAALLTFITASARAEQVVSDEDREWAKSAIEQEKSLDTVNTLNTVAILYFQNKTSQPDLNLLQKGLSLMLITDLSKVKKIQMVERIKVQALVEELGLGNSGVVDPGTASRVGNLLGVEYLVGGDITGKKVGEVQLNSNVLKMPSEKIFGQTQTEGKLFEELMRMEKDLLFAIVNALNIELSSELESELQKPMTTDVNALLNLFKGVDSSDRGDFKAAYRFYQQALEADPGLTPAINATQELYDKGLISLPTQIPALLKVQRDVTSFTNTLTPTLHNRRVKSPKDMSNTCEIRIDWGPVSPNQ